MHQVRAQRRRTTDVVRDQGRAVELPVPQQCGEASPVRGERDLSRAFVGGAKAEQVEHVHGEALG